ncbi:MULTISPECIES: Eco57I restriction-modification methylase domain-containing protein [unclassified Pasteurella]|uniref:Eco57I restriction-modification methylase domain-containing protein n=1 Tax=unclassified Pasteurella TaxID=2621516 RepID=UPI001073E79E|nr:Eco57I restriction-modification methylase domain-containing protein [Pasteurella sp. 19428wF3_WM03]TFU50772.1 restriction endonuclease [Pasteurella sp. WM03]
MTDLSQLNYNPDVLNCLANLSNDEVFTPPELVNQMLDRLPEHLWTNPNAKFLDPVCKSGVFLREIAKRLIEGLKTQIPDLQERLDHIYTQQLYGIAITELTALISRRSLYCSKKANSENSICHSFSDENGNIFYKRIEHNWQNGRCSECGANQSELDRGSDLETHAYAFIHPSQINNILDINKMKFNVIIGNPPYQLGVGNSGGNSSKAKAIYHQFIEQAIKLNPEYLVMIVPSRWMTRQTEGISDVWIDDMLNSNKFIEIHDFLSAKGIFTGTPPEGGVNYFIWSKNYVGKVNYFLYKNSDDVEPFLESRYLNEIGLGIVIRDRYLSSILKKINKIDGNYIKEERNFSTLVSPKDFFTNKTYLTSSWKEFKLDKDSIYSIKYYLNKQNHKVNYGWVNDFQIPKNIKTKELHKVYIPAAYGGMEQVLGFPFYGEPNSVCSQTYLVIGYDPDKHKFSKEECLNIITYIRTKFFRYLVSIKKKTQNGPRGVYELVPIQDFSKPWTDEELYKKYGLTQNEIEFIEKMIRPMEVENG